MYMIILLCSVYVYIVGYICMYVVCVYDVCIYVVYVCCIPTAHSTGGNKTEGQACECGGRDGHMNQKQQNNKKSYGNMLLAI